MKICPSCGARMWRHSDDVIKTTGERKVRLRCTGCHAWESHYYPPNGGPRKIEQRRGGASGFNDE